MRDYATEAGAEPERRVGADTAISPSVAALLDAALNAVLVVDESGTITYANSRALKLFGYAALELVGGPLDVLLPEGVRAHHQRHVHRFLEAPVTRSVTADPPLRALHRDGRVIPVEIALIPVRSDDGAVRVVTSVVDITSRLVEQERIRALNRSYLTLAKMSQVVMRSRQVSSLYADTCRVAVEAKGFAGAWVAVPDEDHRVSLAASAGSLGAYLDQLRLSLDPADPRGDAPTVRALRDGRTTYVQDFLGDGIAAHWRDVGERYGVRSMAALPLRRGGQVVAALVLYSDRPDAFPQRVRALLEQVAGNVSFALDALAGAERLREVAAQRAELMTRVVTAQESERIRIAGDIHDESVQSLAAIDLRLGLLKGRLRESAPDLEPSVSQIQQTLGTAIAGLRSLLFELEPGDLDAGLLSAIEDTADRVFEQHPVAWRLTTEDGVDLSKLTSIEQTQVLRIVKESLVNVRKHSLAESVEITLSRRDGGVEFVVADDGVGVDPDALPRRQGHRGLQTMQDRAAVVGGWLEIERAERGGMAVRLWVPASGEPVR